MRRNILPLLLIFGIGTTFVGCEDEQKVCRCMVFSNIEDVPNPLFDIIYIDEEESCEDYDDTEENFPQDATENDTIPIVWQTVCRDRLEEFPEED